MKYCGYMTTHDGTSTAYKFRWKLMQYQGVQWSWIIKTQTKAGYRKLL